MKINGIAAGIAGTADFGSKKSVLGKKFPQ
jgi:hypothetical protein